MLRRIYLNLITLRGTKPHKPHTHHGYERAVSILSGGNALFCIWACRLFTAPPGGQQQHNTFVVQTAGGLTACQICLRIQTQSLDPLVTCNTYLLFSVNQNPVIQSHFFVCWHWLWSRECMVQQHIHLDKPQGLGCCELLLLWPASRCLYICCHMWLGILQKQSMDGC